MAARGKSLTPQEVSSDAHSMIDAGFASRKSVFEIQRSLSEKLGEKVTRKRIEELKDARKKKVNKKLLFKKTGAELVKEFLEKVKEGEDVSHLQSVMEHAVYIDCLNRYSTDTEAFKDWSLKDVIKVANDYKKMQAKGEQGEKLSGALAAKLFDLVRSVFLRDAELKRVFEKKEKSFLQKLERHVADDSMGSELEDMDAMQALYEKHVKKTAGSSNA
jgi:hypothetical protein